MVQAWPIIAIETIKMGDFQPSPQRVQWIHPQYNDCEGSKWVKKN